MIAIDTERLYSGMLEQLEKINGSIKESVKNLTDSLFCVASVMEQLKRFVRSNPFSDEGDEIEFFKYTKPRFYAWYIYLVELHNVLLTVPIGTDQMIRDYYMDELGTVNRCFRIYSFAYQYYLKDESSKDAEFFLCKNKVAFPAGQELLAQDIGFSTNSDFIFSKFRAFEMLRDFIIRRLRLLYQNPDNLFIAELLSNKNRWWSGDKVELVEIAYGIYYTRRINGGRAEISDIIGWLEDSLNVDLGQAYRMFLDIRRRKTVSYTKFLDEMRVAIEDHIEQSNGLRPGKKSSKK
jgi:hypothetical protein